MHTWVINHKETQGFDSCGSQHSGYCWKGGMGHDWDQQPRGASEMASDSLFLDLDDGHKTVHLKTTH